MSHPAKFLVKFWIAKAWAGDEPLTQAAVNLELDRLRLPRIGQRPFDDLVATFAPPEGFDLDDRSMRGPTRAYMQAERIELLWTGENADVRRMQAELLSDWVARDALDVLLMSRAPAATIAELVTRRAKPRVPFTANLVLAYRHFCWNIDALSRAEWVELTRSLPRGDAMMAAYDHGLAQAAHRVGFAVEAPTTKGALKVALVDAFMDLQILRSMPVTKQSVSMRGQLTRTIIEVVDAMAAHTDDRLAEEAKAIRHFVLEHRDPNIMSLDVIRKAGGSFTGDGTVSPARAESNTPGDQGDHSEAGAQ